MLKWKRTPQQTRRPTKPGVSGEPWGQGKDEEVTPFPSLKPSDKTMEVEIRNGVDSITTTTETKSSTRYTRRPASNLTRTDSGKSSRSNKSLGTLSAFDPDSAGTLARDTEVTYSMYDGLAGDGRDTHEEVRGSSRGSSSYFKAVDPQIPSQKGQSGGGTSTRTSTTTTTTYRSSGTSNGSHNSEIEINGDHMNIEPSGGKQIKTTTTTTKMTTTKGISSSDSKIKDFPTDTKETNDSIISALDDLLVDLDDHDKSFDETMVTASLDRKAISQRPRNPAKKVGSFSIRSAFDDNPTEKKTVSNTSLHDDKFKGELSSKLLNGHQEKVTLSDPDLNTNTSNYSSIKRETTTSGNSSSSKFGSGQDITNVLDRNLQMSSGSNVDSSGALLSNGIASHNGHDPNLIENEVTATRNSKTSSSMVVGGGSDGGVTSSTTAQSAVVSGRSLARRESRESTATSVTRTASQKSDQNNNSSRPSSRATERSEHRSSIVRSDSGRSPTPPQFKVRDIRGSLSRPSSSLSSGGGDRTSGTFRAYSPSNRASYSSSPTREEVSVTSANVVTSSTGRVKRVDSGASTSSRQGGTETSSKRTSVISNASSAGVAAGTGAAGLPDVQEDKTSVSGASTSQRTSVISTTSRSSTITGSRQESPTRAAVTSISRNSSRTSQGSKLAGGHLGSRPTSAASRGLSPDTTSKRSSITEGRPLSLTSKSESQGHVSRSESQRSKATTQRSTSTSSSSSLTSYNFSGQEKTRKQSRGSDTDDKLIDGVDTEPEEKLQKSEITVVEKVPSVYTSGVNLQSERVVNEEKRSSSRGETILTSSTSLAEKSDLSFGGKKSDYPEPPQASSLKETYDSNFTADDAEKATYDGYTTQSSYGSLTSTDGDKSFRKSASNLLEDFKSGRLTSAESTLEKQTPPEDQPRTPEGDAGEVFTSSSSFTTETRATRISATRPANISLMGVKSLEKSSTTRDTQSESTDRQIHDGIADSSTASASGSRQALNGDNTPKSPTVKEAQKAVTPGLVNKLSKDLFANLNLTGRFVDPSTPRAKSPEPNAEEKGEDPEKKYKFLIEGIDTPAQEEEIQPEKAAQDKAELSPGIDSLERKPRGFSYLKIDSALAGEIQKRAETVHSKKPHEAIEVKKASGDKTYENHYESLELKEAKAKLHRQIIQSHQQQSKPTAEVESAAQSLREARAKLNKQIVEEKITSSSRELEEESPAPSVGFKSEPSHVGGSQTQTQLHSQLQQQIRDRVGQRKQPGAASGGSGEVSRVEPGGQPLVTPVDDKDRGTTTNTGRSTLTVREEGSTVVPQPPPPPPLATPISLQPTQLTALSFSPVDRQQQDQPNRKSTSKTSTKHTVQIEDIGEDTAEDYREKKGKHEHNGQPCEIYEDEIVPKRSALLYDPDNVKEQLDKTDSKALHNGEPCEIHEECIVPQHSSLLYDPDKKQNKQKQRRSGSKQKSTAQVIEVIEPVISVSKRNIQSERSGGNQGYSIGHIQEVAEDNIQRRSGENRQNQQSRREIDAAFDLLERERKQNHDEQELPPRASTSTASTSGVNHTRTAALNNYPAGAGPQQKPSTTSEGGLTDQLSPDSAYQSAAASPIFATNQTPIVKDISSSQQYLRPARQEPIMVQRGEELVPYPGVPVVGQQQQQQTRSKMMMKSTKMSSQSSKQMVNGATVQQGGSRELSERQMQYENSGRPHDEGVMITSSRNESMAYRGAGPPEPVTAIGGGPNTGNTIHHPIQMNGDVTGAQYPSAAATTVDSTRIMNSAQTDFNSDVRQHQAQHIGRAQPQHGGGSGGGGYSASSSEGFNNTTNRYQDDLHYQQHNRTGVTRKASHLSSTSSAGSGQRIVQLRPLTVDVNMANRGGGTSGPSGMFSPSVKHSQAMYEIQNMTGGSYAQYNGYSPGQLQNNVDTSLYSTSNRVYRNSTQPPRKYMKVRDMNYNDIGHRDLEGYQYRKKGRHPYVARVNLEGDPYYSDFEGGSVHSEPMTRLQRRISSRSRQRTLPPGTRHWSSSQPTGLHQVPLGDPVHLNIHPQQGHGYGSSPSPGRLYKARSEGMLVEAAMNGRAGVGGGEILSPTLTDAHQTRRGDYHITLKLNHLGRGMLDSASTGSYDQGWGTLGDEASNTWDYKSAASWQRNRKDPKASVSLVDIELNDSGVHEPQATRQPTTVTLHAEPKDQQDGSLQHWFRAYHQHHEAMYNGPSTAPPAPVATDPEISTTIPRYNSNPPGSPQNDAAFAMQVNQTMRMDYKPNEQEEEPVPNVVRGSILIKNTIDTTGGARVIDVVETETDGEGELHLENNTNLFHSGYKQGKENPMYNSDEDLSKLVERQPAFTNIFQKDETDYVEIPITKEKPRKKPPPREEGWVSRAEGQEEQLDITRLLRNAPAGSVKQTINVEREEEEILGPMPLNDAEGEMSDPDGLLNFDTISEKVDLGVLDGKAQLAVKVRCERVVPIRGVEDMFKKSSVIVTRLIQIDMEATEERQRLYRRIMRGSNQQMIEGPDDRYRSRTGVRKLDTKDTFNLYKAFMGVAEAHEGNERERVKIERRIEDSKQLPEQAEFEFNMAGDDIMGNGYADGYDDMDYEDGDFDTEELERRLERKMKPVGDSGMRLEEMPGGRGQYMMKNPEPDTISYISQASENHDLLY